ncbi:MAG: PilZ domain-containing protein [Myxococcaceae bacterium]|nr:PilZ domain-containing protein [Myxococcaceae bacterium]
MSDRRKSTTKNPDVAKSDRRIKDDERRDSPRVPMKFLLRDMTEGGSYVEREGDLSLGGIYWKGKYPPHGTDVEVRFRLAGVTKEIRAKGEIIRVMDRGNNIDFHVRFVELDVSSELAIAKYLDEVTR